MDLMDFLARNLLVLVAAATVLGMLVGSFINVVVYRLPIMLQRDWQQQAHEYLEIPQEKADERFNLLLPDSRCPHCGHKSVRHLLHWPRC